MKSETKITLDANHYMRVLIADYDEDTITSTIFYAIEDGIDFITRVVDVCKDGQVNTLDYKSVGYGREKILDSIIERNGDNRAKWVPEEEWGHAFTDSDTGIVQLYASDTDYQMHFGWFRK